MHLGSGVAGQIKICSLQEALQSRKNFPAIPCTKAV